jgi:hypothetical protein
MRALDSKTSVKEKIKNTPLGKPPGGVFSVQIKAND